MATHYKEMKQLAAAILRTKSIGKIASLGYVLDLIWDWVESSAHNGIRQGLADHISDALDRDVRERELWFPLHRVHADTELKIGPVQFRTLDREMMQRWHETALARVPVDAREKVSEHYNRLRSRMQGSLAAIVHVTGEARKAHHDGLQTAQMAISMLRSISPANWSPRIRSYCTLLGHEAIHVTQVLTVKEGNLVERSEAAAEGNHSASSHAMTWRCYLRHY